jgi:uncharacterized protein with NRDE domain
MMYLVILRRPDHCWPVLLAVSHDAPSARSARLPARHWPDRPEVSAILDHRSGGSRLGVNDHGVVAVLLERAATSTAEPTQRQRGELVLEALDHAEASAAAGALAELRPAAYQPFNLLVADPRAAYWIRHGDDGRMRVQPISAGLHMLSSTELDDPAHPWIAAYLPRFKTTAVPDPERGAWSDWRDLLARPDDPVDARLDSARPARSSDLIALPAYPGFNSQSIWLQAEGGPGRCDDPRLL